MHELTIGYVAGLISLGVFIVQVLYPTTFTFILAGVLREKETAATWSVAGRALQSSWWPDILRADTTRSVGVRKTIRVLKSAKLVLAVLVTVASIVTPLGLYDALELSDATFPEFEYAADTSAFGPATPPRSDLSFNRYCLSDGGGSVILERPIPCPGSEFEAVVKRNGSSVSYDYPSGYNNTVPAVLHDIYASGTRQAGTTVSNFFDVQWRQYGRAVNDFSVKLANGTEYLIGKYNSIVSMFWDDGVHLVEGLVVDMRTGALGFRNHTIPTGQQYAEHGAVWAEDLLFIEPETACVDTNLTFEFTMALPRGSSSTLSPYSEYSLVDRGGFASLNQTYPEYDHDNAQNHPDLQARAFKAAYLHNAFTMAYLNVTSIRPAWRYLNSKPGQKFPLPLAIPDDYTIPTISNFEPTWLLPGNSTFRMNAKYANPYNISANNFQSIEITCAGTGGADFANASNIFVSCGLLRGPPRPVDALSPLAFSEGSKWTSSLYSCASAVKASIKTVTFTLDGNSNGGSSSSPGMNRLSVTSITPKTYSSPSSAPLWGIEDAGMKLSQIKPLWGLLSSDNAHAPNVSAVQKPELYLVATGETSDPFPPYFGAQGMSTAENLPAATFPFIGLNTVYRHLNSLDSGALPDYLGRSSLGSIAKWQSRMTDPASAAGMVNAIWADISAAAVVGTKGAHSVGGLQIAVRPVVHRVKYHLEFAVPALVVMGASLAVLAVAAVMAALPGRSGLHAMRVNLKRTAVGRALALLTEEGARPGEGHGAFVIAEQEWAERNGPKEVEFHAPASPKQ